MAWPSAQSPARAVHRTSRPNQATPARGARRSKTMRVRQQRAGHGGTGGDRGGSGAMQAPRAAAASHRWCGQSTAGEQRTTVVCRPKEPWRFPGPSAEPPRTRRRGASIPPSSAWWARRSGAIIANGSFGRHTNGRPLFAAVDCRTSGAEAAAARGACIARSATITAGASVAARCRTRIVLIVVPPAPAWPGSADSFDDRSSRRLRRGQAMPSPIRAKGARHSTRVETDGAAGRKATSNDFLAFNRR